MALSLNWELTVTKQINELVDLAITEKDHITEEFSSVVRERTARGGLEHGNPIEHRSSSGREWAPLVEDYLARRGGSRRRPAPAAGQPDRPPRLRG